MDIEIAKSGNTLTGVGMLEVNVDWTYISGSVDLSSATVKFQDGTSTIDSGTMIFADVILDNDSSSNVNVVGTMDVNGDLTIACELKNQFC